MPDTQNTGLLGILPPSRILPDMPGVGGLMGNYQPNPSAFQFVSQLQNQPGGSPFAGGPPPMFGTPWAYGMPVGLPSPEATISYLPPAPTPAPGTAPITTPTQPNYDYNQWYSQMGAGRDVER